MILPRVLNVLPVFITLIVSVQNALFLGLLLPSTTTCTAFVVVSTTNAVAPTSSRKRNHNINVNVNVNAVTSTMPTKVTHSKSSSSSTSLAAAGLELVDPSYNLAIGSFVIGLGSGFLEDLRDKNDEKLLTAKPFGLLALLFTIISLFIAFQTTTLRFGFDDDSFSLVKASGASLVQENVVVGGENKWKYTSFQNYDYLPSSKFPILVYFREDQTPIENREEVDVSVLQVDTLEGQVHYFPAISNTQQLTQGFEKHNCAHID
mmetsp:Transcript_3890/g.4386  ORF Transcript_3890/g.4386 Transcript_3890/m.4386 type:complete len:262 (+) Transcript_3890:109-894(+)